MARTRLVTPSRFFVFRRERDGNFYRFDEDNGPRGQGYATEAQAKEAARWLEGRDGLRREVHWTSSKGPLRRFKPKYAPAVGELARRAREQPYEDDPDAENDLPDDEQDEWADFDLETEMQDGIVIGDARRGGYAVSASGRSVGTFADFDEALLAAERWMQSQQYFPNVFYVNDHGNVDLLALTPKIVRGKTIKVDSKIIKSWV